MSEVRLQIGGVTYKVACAAGEESQVLELGSIIDGKLQQMKGNLSTSSAQNLLFAALLLADELQEAQGASAKSAKGADAKAESAANELKLELDAMRTERDESLRELAMLKQATEQDMLFADGTTSQKLEEIAASLESCASLLEAKGGLEDSAPAS